MVFTHGEGAWVYDEHGNRLLEGIAGLWSASLGFSEQRLVGAAYRQLQKLPFMHMFASASHPPGIALAKELLQIAPVPMARVFFANSGSEAIDSAVKMIWFLNNALGRTQKKKIIARRDAYHGSLIASASLTGLPKNHKLFDLPLPGFLHTTKPHYYRFAHEGESEREFSSRLASELDAQIIEEGPETVAAFFAEPIMGVGGVILPPEGYFEEIQRVLKKHDVLLVAGGSSSVPRQAAEAFTAADVQKWLTHAEQVGVENIILQKGIEGLEYLLAEITLLSMPMEVATHPLKAIFVGHTDHVWSVAFSPDGQTLANGSWDNTIRLWDTHTAQHKMTLIGHTAHVWSVAFSPDGQTLASPSWDRTIRLWNPHTGQLKRILRGHSLGVSAVTFSPDGQILASGNAGPTVVRLSNTTTWQVERILTGHTHLVEVLAFSLDGLTLASGSRDETIRLWNPHTGNHIRTLPATSVYRLAFSPDGGTLASGGLDNTIRLWNPHTGKLKRTLPNQGGWINPVAFSPDGAILAIGNRGISLWDIETGQYKEPLAEDIGDAISLAFNTDGTMLASGSADGTVRLWDFIPADTSSDDTNGDINGDGLVNVLDLVVIASELGNEGKDLTADVNRDGVVNILDLILIAGMFDAAAAAPSAQPQVPETLTAVEVRDWLTDARALEIKDLIMKRGIVVLEQLLISLTPKETELLANYPNPLNPETWIPYRLAEDAFVTLTIYDLSGQVIRTLNLGHRTASAYESRSKAIYWDGRNGLGEPVASGIYFYNLMAGDFSATRRMVILK